MTLLKCLNKLLDKYRKTIIAKNHQEYQGIETANQISACFAKPVRTTILTASIPSYHNNHLHHHQLIRLGFKGVKARANSSVCGSCRRNEKFFCKCCGKQLNRSVVHRNGSKKLLPTNELLCRNSQLKTYSAKKSTKRKEATASDKTYKQTNHLKKSQAMINIKRIDSKEFKSSFLSSSVDRSKNEKRSRLIRAEKHLKVASFVSSTLIENRRQQQQKQQQQQHLPSPLTRNKIQIKLMHKSSFLVDFSSTPIKLVPLTSTPIKNLLFKY